MIAAPKRILNQYGEPFKANGRPRAELSKAFAKTNAAKRDVRGSYDAASNSDEFKNYWANADSFDADSANSPAVRRVIVARSRYEVANNGYSDGIASTYANDMIGLGPVLRMQTGSEGFNRMVELSWWSWTQEIRFRRKLWCLARAKHVDGEGIAVARQNKRLRHPVKLDWQLHETEQCTTPALPFGAENYIDGIKFDAFGNPEWYDILRHHPGAVNGFAQYSLAPERVPARFVAHWFRMLRPGQHRGVPEMASTLNLGAAARRWREAVLAAAENIADFSLFIKTQFQPDEMDSVPPMDTIDIQKRMMTALPAGYDAFQPRAEQPTATHAEFSKSLVSEQARPKSMPLNKAACDSSSYNYASGRLDHQTYYGSLDVEREDCNDLVLNPLFDVWFDLAVTSYGWLGGVPDSVSDGAKAHVWDWPKHQVADIKAEAAANDSRLKNGSTSLTAIYTEAGQDYEDEMLKQSVANGVTVDQQRQINLLLNLPQHVIPVVSQLLGLTPQPTPGGAPDAAAV